MSALARALHFFGKGPEVKLASAATITIPPEHSVFTITGTTNITALAVDRIRPGRVIVLRGENVVATNVTLTNTAIAGAASGQMYLTADFVMTRGKVLVLVQQLDGVWVKVN